MTIDLYIYIYIFFFFFLIATARPFYLPFARTTVFQENPSRYDILRSRYMILDRETKLWTYRTNTLGVAI